LAAWRALPDLKSRQHEIHRASTEADARAHPQEISPMEEFKSLTRRLLTVSNKQLKDELERERLAKPDQRNQQR
jgi:hypothetical protein